MIGQTLDGRYAILRHVGEGGMGAVYEARHVGTGRRVAVKVVVEAGAQTKQQIARFEREARAVGALESDYIAQVFDTGRDAVTGAPYIAMEFLEGEDVNDLINRLGPLPVGLALRIATQAALGLTAAHEGGVIHRDVKPANIFLARKAGGQRVAKLLDFGIAKVAPTGGENHALTKTGALMGSPLYMSPEQARGEGRVDARSDIWSLGVSLFHCLAGRRPNEDIQGLGQLLISICGMPAPWLQDLAPWVPADVAALVQRALAIDPTARFATAREMADALAALIPGGPSIDEAMLVPLSTSETSRVAPRSSAAPVLASSADAASSAPSSTSPAISAVLSTQPPLVVEASHGPSLPPSVPPPGEASGSRLSTSGTLRPATSLGTTGGIAAPPSRSLPVLVIGAALALAGVAAVTWTLARGSAPPPSVATSAVATALPAPSAAPAAKVAVTVTPAPDEPPKPAASASAVPPSPAPVISAAAKQATPRPVQAAPAPSTKKPHSDDETSRK